jgi:hypothetical protein
MEPPGDEQISERFLGAGRLELDETVLGGLADQGDAEPGPMNCAARNCPPRQKVSPAK